MTNPTAEDLPLSLLEWGHRGTTLVFLHYFSGAAISWQWVAEELRADCHCIALDLPGFGSAPPLEKPSLKAYSDFVWAALNQLKVERFVLIGHSMGGKIALQVAADAASDGLQQVVLVAPSPPTQEPMPKEEQTRLLNHHPSADNAATTIEKATQKSLFELQRAIAIQTHTKAATSAWRWWLLEGMHNSIADQMHRVKVPIKVLASQDDPVIPYETIQQDVIGLLPNAQLIEIANVGHLMPLEAPDLLAQEILRILI